MFNNFQKSYMQLAKTQQQDCRIFNIWKSLFIVYICEIPGEYIEFIE